MTTKKERAAALAAMTKAELVRTITKLDARQTKLLNQLARAKSDNEMLYDTWHRAIIALRTRVKHAGLPQAVAALEEVRAETLLLRAPAEGAITGRLPHVTPPPPAFPWETDK